MTAATMAGAPAAGHGRRAGNAAGRRTRVLLIQEAMGGGCARHTIDLALGLDPGLFDVSLVYGAKRADRYFRSRAGELASRVRLIRCDDLVREISPAHDWRALLAVTGLIRRLRPDVVHCHSTKAGMIGRSAARLCRVPKVFYTPHAYAFQSDQVSPWRRAMYVALERAMAHLATTCTFNVSEGECWVALQRRVARPDRMCVIVNGLDDVPLPPRDEARRMLGLPLDAPVIGVVARMVDQKDPATAARIAAAVIAHDPGAHVAFVGAGPLEGEVRRLCGELGCGANAHFLGERSDADRIVTAFDVSLLTSLYEGMPYSLIESLRAGVPIAASDVTGNDEVVVDGVNGCLFPAGDVPAGAAAVERLLAGPYAPDEIRESFLGRFRLDRMVGRIAGHYLGDPDPGDPGRPPRARRAARGRGGER